jgi:dsDNA-specific endonuclease/ATPase MutS2
LRAARAPNIIILMRFFARLFRKKPPDETARIEADESLDPEDPFPEIVVVEFGDVLDLHSIPPRQARAVVEDYLEEGHRRGARFLRIIHGRGIGVQREMVRSVLARTPYVTDFRDAPAEAGGWGATVVTLGPRPDAGRD